MRKIALTMLFAFIFFGTTPVSGTSGTSFEIDIFFMDQGSECVMCLDDYPLEDNIRLLMTQTFAQYIEDGSVVLNYFNLHRSAAFSIWLSERADLAGVDKEELEMPVFFTQDNRYFDGSDAIERLKAYVDGLDFDDLGKSETRQVPYMPEDAVIAPRHDDPYNLSVTDSVIVYFYTPWCPFCYEIAPIMDNLPEYVMINGQRSNVRLISYNRDIPEHREIIIAYHEKLNIAEERRFVPLVLIGDRNLFLYEEVSQGLLSALEAGEGLTTPLFTERIEEDNNQRVVLFAAFAVIAFAGLIYIVWIRRCMFWTKQ